MQEKGSFARATSASKSDSAVPGRFQVAHAAVSWLPIFLFCLPMFDVLY